MADDPQPIKAASQIEQRLIEGEMKQSYLTYSMSVIVGRALPDVRDGLKPVHKRILFAMNDLGMVHNKPFKKSARIVGEVLGKYHPHGDAAVYDSMVRMAQTFSLRYPLINGQGNFGSVDGDSPASMRYTEAKLQRLAEEMLQDINKETVPFKNNFDDSLKEPTVLPSKIPNLLINGSSGIAVGMATNIPPHNITEICNGVIQLIDNPGLEVDDLLDTVLAPDFPTGGTICGTAGIKLAYKTGRGKLLVRSNHHTEEVRKDKQAIIITEIPYQVNKATLIEEIAHKVKDKAIVGITDLRDESDRDGMRIVIELKNGADPEVVLNQLYKQTRAQTTFGVIMLALDNFQPKVMDLLTILQKFLDHRVEIVTKRTQYDLRKAEERSHILEGLIIALDNIDPVVQLIKGAASAEVARVGLMSKYSLSEIQAKSILEMRLQRLTSMEQSKIRDEQKDLQVKISDYKDILANEPRVFGIIKTEMNETIEKYGDDRRTLISEAEAEDIDMEALIKPEDMVVTLSHVGYIKRLPATTYREQKRGGRGVTAAGTRDEDFIEHLFIANTHSYILFFTNKGKVKWLKVFNLPQASRTAKGSALVNILELEKDEKVTAFVPVKEFKSGHYVIFATEQGVVKRTPLEAFSKPRKGGIIALGLREGDHLVNAVVTDGKQNIMLATENGMAVKFQETGVRSMGRTATGVRGIKLKGDDKVIGMIKVEPGKCILTLCRKGFGKRTDEADYRVINRGGIGVTNVKITSKNGKVVAVKSVSPDDSVMFISRNGIIIRTAVANISEIGRNTQGVRVMKVGDGDEVISAALVPNEDKSTIEEIEEEVDINPTQPPEPENDSTEHAPAPEQATDTEHSNDDSDSDNTQAPSGGVTPSSNFDSNNADLDNQE